MAGYRLKLTFCAAAVACGPQVEPPAGMGTDGSGGSEDTSSSGGPVATVSSSSSPSTTETPPSSSSSGAEESSSSGSSSSEDTGPVFPRDDCFYPGDVCEEFLVCQCQCDTPGCCFCEPSECTEDAHCDGELCGQLHDAFDIDLACVPKICGYSMDAAMVGDASEYEGDVCLTRLTVGGEVGSLAPLASVQYVHRWLTVDSTDLTDLTGLENVTEIGVLEIDQNPSLVDISQLAGVQRIREGGYVRFNDTLPAADVNALLADIEGGDEVQVCGNLDDVDC